jgi:hypothetical protein
MRTVSRGWLSRQFPPGSTVFRPRALRRQLAGDEQRVAEQEAVIRGAQGRVLRVGEGVGRLDRGAEALRAVLRPVADVGAVLVVVPAGVVVGNAEGYIFEKQIIAK